MGEREEGCFENDCNCLVMTMEVEVLYTEGSKREISRERRPQGR